MKELLELTGGYKRHMTYLLKLQSEVMGVQNSLFKNLGHDLVLSGCAVTDNLNGTVNLSAGYVYVDGEIMRFAGANNVAYGSGAKALIKGASINTDPRNFADESAKNTYKETFAIVGDTSNSAVQIVVKNTALYSFKDFISEVIASYGQKGETKWVIDLDGEFLGNFDNTGLGITPKWSGWALMNDNNGAPTMAGRTPIGVGSFVDAYGLQHNYTDNQTGGQPRHKLTLNESAKHDHYMASNTGTNSPIINSAGGLYIAGRGLAGNNGDYTLSRTPTVPNTGKVSSAGEDQPHNNMQPFRAGYWVIKIA